ncbi:MAG: MFS transporter [Chthoniobacterales bacterium]
MKLDNKKLLFLISLGSLLEYYDFGIYIFLAPLVGKSLIPASSAWFNLFLSYSILAISALVRPLGGFIFAHLGDTRGRKYTFVYTILLMAVPTTCIAFIPSAHSIGIWAAVLLVFFRILQGFALGGEISGSIVFAYELSSTQKKSFNTAMVIMGTNIGFFLASSICTLFIGFQFQNIEGWRFAFLLGGLFGIVSYFMRKSLVETPTFTEYKRLLKQESAPLKLLLEKYKKPLFQMISIGCLLSSGLAVFNYYAPYYLSEFYHFPLQQLMKFNTYTILIFSVGSLLAGIFHQWLGKKFFLCFVLTISMGSLLLFFNYGNLTLSQIFFFHSLLLLEIGIICGRYPVLIASFFPVSVRYSGVAFAHNIGFGIVAGCTQMILTWLIQVTGIIWVPALYICFFTVLAMIALMTIRPKQMVEYQD